MEPEQRLFKLRTVIERQEMFCFDATRCHADAIPCHLGLSSGNAVPSMPSRAMQAIHAIQAIIASEQAMRAMQAIMETSA